MRRIALLAAAVLAVLALLAACGGSGGRLSAAEYRAKLATISRQANRAQTEVEKGLHAKTVKDLQARLTTFANAEQQIASEVRALKPPKDAQEANSELAVGAEDTGKATQAAATKIGRFKTPKAAVAALQSSLGNAKGGHELDDALSKLKRLGYTKGS